MDGFSDCSEDSFASYGRGGGRRRGGRNSNVTKNSEEYRKLRERNNQAVRRSRNKSKIKARETHEKVSALRAENEALENRVSNLKNELVFLKELFMKHMGAQGNDDLEKMDLSFLREDEN